MEYTLATIVTILFICATSIRGKLKERIFNIDTCTKVVDITRAKIEFMKHRQNTYM